MLIRYSLEWTPYTYYAFGTNPDAVDVFVYAISIEPVFVSHSLANIGEYNEMKVIVVGVVVANTATETILTKK